MWAAYPSEHPAQLSGSANIMRPVQNMEVFIM